MPVFKQTQRQTKQDRVKQDIIVLLKVFDENYQDDGSDFSVENLEFLNAFSHEEILARLKTDADHINLLISGMAEIIYRKIRRLEINIESIVEFHHYNEPISRRALYYLIMVMALLVSLILLALVLANPLSSATLMVFSLMLLATLLQTALAEERFKAILLASLLVFEFGSAIALAVTAAANPVVLLTVVFVLIAIILFKIGLAIYDQSMQENLITNVEVAVKAHPLLQSLPRLPDIELNNLTTANLRND